MHLVPMHWHMRYDRLTNFWRKWIQRGLHIPLNKKSLENRDKNEDENVKQFTQLTETQIVMLRLENLEPGISLAGIEPTLIATLIAVVPIGDGAVQVIYKTPEGTIKERLLGRADEASISLATVERPWAFDGDGAAFKLAVEAKRIDLAFLFDPDDGRPHLQRRTAAAPDHGRLRVDAAAPAAALRPCRRSRRRQDHHGRPLHPRTASCGPTPAAS